MLTRALSRSLRLARSVVLRDPLRPGCWAFRI